MQQMHHVHHYIRLIMRIVYARWWDGGLHQMASEAGTTIIKKECDHFEHSDEFLQLVYLSKYSEQILIRSHSNCQKLNNLFH